MSKHHGTGRLSAMWRGLGYLLGNLFTGAVALFALPVLLVPVTGRAWASWHRRRADRLLRLSARSGPVRVGPWRVIGWLCACIVTSLAFGLVVVLCAGNAVATAITVPLWWALPAGTRAGGFGAGVQLTGWGTALTLGTGQVVVFAALTYWLVPVLARLHARMCGALLSPSATEVLAQRVETLTGTRVDAMNAHGAELRRIERDLHDGTQARLVSIAMRLGVARELLAEDPQAVAGLLEETQESTEEAMAELRTVLRTIYPPILADRGLAGALTALGARSAIDTTLDVGDLGTVPAAVEAVAYFTIAEALTNAAKHSRATRTTVRVARDGDRLSIEVADDGVGGADETRYRPRRDPPPCQGARRHPPRPQPRRRPDHDHCGAGMRVVIAEDNVLLSSGLELLLTAKGFDVAAITEDAPGFIAAVAEHRPDVTIVDVRLPPTFRDEGIHAAIRARRRQPGLPVLVLSQYVEQQYAGELISDGRGGVGYLLKDRVSRVSEFTDALRRVAAGGTVMDPEVIGQLLTRPAHDPIAALTPRERDVLALMAEGRDNATIAARLVITDNAVHKHIGNIFAKLGLSPADSGHRRVLAVLTYLSRH